MEAAFDEIAAWFLRALLLGYWLPEIANEG
jgi:hypothetical protein